MEQPKNNVLNRRIQNAFVTEVIPGAFPDSKTGEIRHFTQVKIATLNIETGKPESIEILSIAKNDPLFVSKANEALTKKEPINIIAEYIFTPTNPAKSSKGSYSCNFIGYDEIKK